MKRMLILFAAMVIVLSSFNFAEAGCRRRRCCRPVCCTPCCQTSCCRPRTCCCQPQNCGCASNNVSYASSTAASNVVVEAAATGCASCDGAPMMEGAVAQPTPAGDVIYETAPEAGSVMEAPAVEDSVVPEAPAVDGEGA